MSPAAPAEDNTLDSSSVASSPAHAVRNGSANENRRFADLRGVRWRIDLGVLPSSSPSYIEDLRRVTADSRRRYAGLRRRLLVDPNIPKDGSASPDLHIDNPLSQNPDSMWGRFFRNAELERMVDQDLSRLYPEHGMYFQTTECQSMLRRILLIWCLKHPEYGYRQGMHELMAPLLYVLHADVEQLSQMQKLHEDHFIDKFDDFSFYENDVTYSFDYKKLSESPKSDIGLQKSRTISSLDDLDPKLQDIILLSDAYGAEGELGVVLSEKFMEHDAYCMFDALMSGAGGEVAMADFFSPAPLGGSHTGLPPVIEASFALYHLLSIVDASLHSHLVELGVEPQYFALRWLRVLFGREFSLDNLLLLWDEIFACDNSKSDTRDNDSASSFRVLTSPRGAYISAIAVSMMLHMRSSLLATENATSCLQRLLNFPANINLKKLFSKAKSLQALSLDSNNSIPLSMLAGSYDRDKSAVGLRGHSLSLDSISPRTAQSLMPESYWEEKWRNLHKEEELEQRSIKAELPRRRKGWSEKVRLTLSRKGSAPSPSRVDSSKEEPKSVRRNLLEDLSKQLGLEEDLEESRRNDGSGQIGPSEEVRGHCEDGTNKNNSCTAVERKTPDSPSPDFGSESDGSGSNRSGPNRSFDFSVSDRALAEPDYPSPNRQVNQSEGSSVASNSSVDENDDEGNNTESFNTLVGDSPLPVSDSPENGSFSSTLNEDSTQKITARQEHPDDTSSESGQVPSKSGQEHLDEVSPKSVSSKSVSSKSGQEHLDEVSSKSGQHTGTMAKPVATSKDRKPLSGKFQWLWKLGRNNNGEGMSEATRASSHETCQNTAASPAIRASNNSPVSSSCAIDQSLVIALKNLGQSMVENIQVIESVIQKEQTQADNSKGIVVVDAQSQVTAMEALEELRKISNHLRGIGG